MKTKQFANPTYIGDPINAVRIFNEEMADELCIFDISSHNNKNIDFPLLQDIASEAFMPLSYGGGISSLDDARRLFRMGFEKVVFNTALAVSPRIVKDVVDYAGGQSVVASIDIKKSLFYGVSCCYDCGRSKVKTNYLKYIKSIVDLGVGELFVNFIDKDGMMDGYDIRTIKTITSNTSIPVTVCGGAGSLKDMKIAIEEGGAHAVAAGSMFVYFGPRKAVLINYPNEEELIRAGLI